MTPFLAPAYKICPRHEGSHEPFGGEDGSLRKPLFVQIEFTPLHQAGTNDRPLATKNVQLMAEREYV